MRFSKKYIAFALLLVIVIAWKLNTWNDQYAMVETFRGAELKEEVFQPLMSKNLNDSGMLTVYLNNEIYENYDGDIILDNNLNPACSLDFIRDVMKGSIFQEDEKSVILQIGDDIYEFLVDNATATKNGDDYELECLPSYHTDEFFIGISDIFKIFGYEYYYDSESYDVYATLGDVPALPTRYDLRDIGRVSKIRNQGSTATCWACASLEALESSLLPTQQYDFSVDAMVNENSFGLPKEAGGEYTMALAYLLSWQGPKLHSATVNQLISDIAGNHEAQEIHLQEAHFFGSEDLGQIKSSVFRYGGVSTSIYVNVNTSEIDSSNLYNKRTNSYCYTGNNKPNHDVVIIGWDDNYLASNFNDTVPGNGAFICQNSWGENFGENGVFYISYYDTNIGNQAVSYVKTDTKNKYSYIYQSDLCGWAGQIGYKKEWLYGANIFTAGGDQQIEAAGFYALGPNTSYQCFFVSDYKNTGSLANRELVASGVVENAGYYTVKFSSPKEVKEGENFSIVMYISTPGTQRPMAIEYNGDEKTKQVDLTDGLGFISNNGLDWENVEDVAQANLCIKAYGNNVVKVYE